MCFVFLRIACAYAKIRRRQFSFKAPIDLVGFGPYVPTKSNKSKALDVGLSKQQFIKSVLLASRDREQ